MRNISPDDALDIQSLKRKETTMANLKDVEGIGEAYAQKLIDAGIKTTDELLEKCATPGGRKEISGVASVSEKQLLEWANHVDLFRIKGVGEEYTDLLEEAGVDTVPELAQRNPENLHQKLAEINAAKDLVRQLPSAAQVADWVAQVKTLPCKIEY
jgi:predicted flap endonuclease-1-like 5' DNA nuclease